MSAHIVDRIEVWRGRDNEVVRRRGEEGAISGVAAENVCSTCKRPDGERGSQGGDGGNEACIDVVVRAVAYFVRSAVRGVGCKGRSRGLCDDQPAEPNLERITFRPWVQVVDCAR